MTTATPFRQQGAPRGAQTTNPKLQPGRALHGVARWRRALAEAEGRDPGAALDEPRRRLTLLKIFGSTARLSELCMRSPTAAAEAMIDGPSNVIAAAARDLSKLEGGVGAPDTLRGALEAIKARTDLAIAIAEISGSWSAGEGAAARSEFAERLIDTALNWLIRGAVNRGDLAIDPAESASTGVFALAGGDFAHEELAPYGPLEVAIIYDGAAPGGHAASMTERAFARIGAEFQEVFAGKAGDAPLYSLKTPLGAAINGAGLAESLSRARAAFENPQETRFHQFLATARVIAGDRRLGGAFLEETENTNYAAVDLLDEKGDDDPRCAHRRVADVLRLGLGRARPVFRTAPVRMVFEKAAEAGAIEKAQSQRLIAGCEFASGVASRIQFINGGAGFTLSVAEEKTALASLCGFADYNALESVLRGAIADAQSVLPMLIEGPQAEFNRYSPNSGQPDDVEKLEDLGFSDGVYLSRVVDEWAGLAACDEDRRFSAVAPGLLTAFGQTQHPDEAIALFDTLIETLSGDDAVLELAREDGAARDTLVDALGCFGGVVAPLIASEAGARCLLSARDQETFSSGTEWLSRQAAPERDAEISELVNWRREKVALVALATTAGALPFGAAKEALQGIHDITLRRLFLRITGDASVQSLAVHVFDEPTYGLPGSKTLMGLIAAEEPTEATEAAARTFIEAIQGFDVGEFAIAPDLAHRPGGVAGALAPSVDRYKGFIQSEAIASDQILFARARVIAGTESAQKGANSVFRSAVSNPKRADVLFRDLDRARTQRKRREQAASDWDIERIDGGLSDAELIVSTLIYRNAAAQPALQDSNIDEALSLLVRANLLDANVSATLAQARKFWGRLATAKALARWSDPQMQPVRGRFATVLARAAEVERFDQVRPLMRGYAEEVNRLYAQLVLGRPPVSLVANA